MIFTCDKTELSESLNIVSKAIPAKSTSAILEGIYIKCDDDLVLTGNDLELGIECHIEADIREKGSMVLNAKTFLDIIRRLPSDTVSISTDSNFNTTIKCQNIEYKIMAIDGEEFPSIPKILEKGSFTISSNILKSMIRQTIFAISPNDARQVLTGSLFELSSSVLKVVSVDGFRMAIRKENLEGDYSDVSFIIPGKTLNELLKILKDDEIPVKISLTDKYVQFEFENSKIVSRLVEGEFLNYNKIIPQDKKFTIKAQVKSIMESIERCEPILSADTLKNPVRLFIEDNSITLKCVTNMGKVVDVISIDPCKESLEIGFNHKYLHDALRSNECESVLIDFNTPLSPCIIHPTEGDAFLHMILPVRLKGE